MSRYIQLDVGFYTHRKTLRLQARLGNDALWTVPRLWCYALENQTDGDFGKWKDDEITLAIRYAGDPAKFIKALIETEYMTPDKKLVNWEERQSYARMAKSRAEKAAAARWSLEEEKERKKESEQTPSNAKAMLKHKSSGPEECVAYCVEIGLPADDGQWFYDKAEGSGWKNGGQPIKDWKATIRAWKKAGYMASQRTGGKGMAQMRSSFAASEYSKAQLARLRDDLKFAPPEKRDEIREAIAKHEAQLKGQQ